MRILVVEDNEDLGEAISSRLRSAGHSVEWVKNGTDAKRYCELENWDAVLLDIMLPDEDGFSVLRHVRQHKVATPVLVMTARAEIEDKVSMLDLGADDYLVKPFDFRELEARLRVLMRRPSGQTSSVSVLGNLSIDSASRRITINDEHVEFGRREFCLLEILLNRVGQVVSKERLMTQLFNFDEECSPNAIELHISRIRRKLGAAHVRIETVRGSGYCAQLIEEE
ncbi:response regulator transcription factor [Alcaligenes endophyticus]|uniref:Response regulator transcription factor n=1 Tax=Alcaligenes endophyticus TaxID=1929088 RepID=A0ABT8EKM7_9BURK|nr:response regulator transcription factor [Alcaligenes endophyticus]MCX5590798.1 response regulator transcription factor [Alcaligenes endophyticus]MDN4121839.1 response regulator transcription factor [Alcaligenes endophyticus]